MNTFHVFQQVCHMLAASVAAPG